MHAVRSVLTLPLHLRQAGVVWYKEPSLLLFFGAKAGLILYILFVGRCLDTLTPSSSTSSLSVAVFYPHDVYAFLAPTWRASVARRARMLARLCAWCLAFDTLSNLQASTTHTRATSGLSSNFNGPFIKLWSLVPPWGEEQRPVRQTRSAGKKREEVQGREYREACGEHRPSQLHLCAMCATAKRAGDHGL